MNKYYCSSLYSEYKRQSDTQSDIKSDIQDIQSDTQSILEILEYYSNKDFHPEKSEHFQIYQLPISHHHQAILKKQWNLQLTIELDKIRKNKKTGFWKKILKTKY